MNTNKESKTNNTIKFKVIIGIIIFALLYSFGIFGYSLYKLKLLSFSHTLEFDKMDKYSAYLQGVVGLFLNLLTIILVYRTFKQQDDFIKKQNLESAQAKRSEVFFPDIEMYIRDQVSGNEWLQFFKDDEFSEEFNKVKILNIGKSNCKNVKITWEWDIEGCITLINDRRIRFLGNTKKIYGIGYSGNVGGVSRDIKMLVENLDYLLTYENMSGGRDFKFPISYLELFIYYWRENIFGKFQIAAVENTSLHSFNPLTMIIEYEDDFKKVNVDKYKVNCRIERNYDRDSDKANPLSIKFIKEDI